MTFELVEPSKNYDKDFAKIVINRNTKDYEILMKWSKIFLKNKSFTTFSGIDTARALLFPMEKVFESYVACNLKRVFNRVNWEVSAQDKGHYLFNMLNGEKHRKFALRPDLVVTRDDGTVVVLDTKWKKLINDKGANYGISQADMYQMYAYSKKYVTSEIWLLYPVNAAMNDSERIVFDSGDGVMVSLFFVDVVNIEKSMEELLRILSPNITEENLTEEYIDGVNAVG
jgi:5-methylcytosine-specific restriction enzyme subunit McrC